MSDYVTKRRVAHKHHRCECGRGIEPGHVYLEHIGFPGDLLDTVNRIRECAPCAQRYGREHLLDDVPIDQLYQQGLA